MQIDSTTKKTETEFTPMEIVISLNVIQDDKKDGNLNCALIAAVNDILQQIHLHTQNAQSDSMFKNLDIVKKFVFATTCMKMNEKVIVDP